MATGIMSSDQTQDTNLIPLFINAALQSPKIVSYIRSSNTNAAQPGLNQRTVRNLKILVPTTSLSEKFNNLVDDWLVEIVSLAKQNIFLTKTRDLLVPLLITGRRELK